MKSRLLLVLALMSLGACARDQTPSTGGAGWTRIGETFIGLVKWGEGTAFLIYCDCDSEGGSGPRSSSSSHGAAAHAWIRSTDGRTVDWWCQTSDGINGEVRINGRKFKLEDGALFLVSTRGGQTQIEQYKRNLLEMVPDDKKLEGFTKEDPAVKQFISRVEK